MRPHPRASIEELSRRGLNSSAQYRMRLPCLLGGVRSDEVWIVAPEWGMMGRVVGAVMSLKTGRGRRQVSRKPREGARPDAVGVMQIVPPVMIIRMRGSGVLCVGVGGRLKTEAVG